MFSSLKKLKAALLWSQALDLASKHKNEEALGKIFAIEELAIPGYNKQQTRGSIYGNLLKGLLLYETGRRAEALSTLADVQRILGKRETDEEIGYLQCYAHAVAIRIISVWPEQDLYDLVILRTLPNLEAIDLSKVPVHVKRKFPLRDHPAWPE